MRKRNAEQYMRYLYSNMPSQIVKALRYIAKLNEKHKTYQTKHEKYHSSGDITPKQQEEL